MSKQKNYIKNMYANSTKTQFGPMLFINYDIETLKQLKSIMVDGKGKLTLVPQKEDKTKWSIYENKFDGKGGKKDEADDLPF